MRIYYPLFFFALVSTSVPAQWTTDVEQNTMIRDGMDVATKLPTMCKGPQGSTYIGWFEALDESYHVRVQRLDLDGNPMWGEDGVLVCTSAKVLSLSNNRTVRSLDIVPDFQGNVIVGCVAGDQSTAYITLFKLDPAGGALWDQTGVQVFSGWSSNTQTWLDMEMVNDSSLVITKGGMGRVEVMHLDMTGAPRWSNPITFLPSTTQVGPYYSSTSNYYPSVAAVNDSSFALTFDAAYRGPGGIPPPLSSDIRCRIYKLDGTLVRSFNRLLGYDSFTQYPPFSIADGAGGCYILYRDQTKLRLSRLALGPNSWHQDLPKVQLWDSVSMTLTSNGAGVMVAYCKYSTFHEMMGVEEGSSLLPPVHYELRVQLVDSLGAAQLGSFGSLLVEDQRCVPFGIAPLEDGAIISYLKRSDRRIYAVRVDMAGQPIWADTSMLVSSNLSAKAFLSASEVRDDHCVVLWRDRRNASGVYGQRFPINGPDIVTTTDDPTRSPESFELRAVQLDEESLLEVNSSARGTAILRMYDTGGRLLKTADIRLSQGVQLISLGPLHVGMVIVELSMNGVGKRIKMVLP